MKPFLRSKPDPLAGYLDPLVTISCNQHAETPWEYWMAGSGPIVVNCFKFGLLDLPHYCSISITNLKQMCQDGAGPAIFIVPKVAGGHILAADWQFVVVFCKDKAETLTPHWLTNPAIHLKLSYNLQPDQI